MDKLIFAWTLPECGLYLPPFSFPFHAEKKQRQNLCFLVVAGARPTVRGCKFAARTWGNVCKGYEHATCYAHRAGTIFTKKKPANLTIYWLVVALDWILLRCPKCLVRFAYGISTAAPPPCPLYPPLAAGARGRQRHSDYERDSLRSPGPGILCFSEKKNGRSFDLPFLVVAGAGFEPTTFGL